MRGKLGPVVRWVGGALALAGLILAIAIPTWGRRRGESARTSETPKGMALGAEQQEPHSGEQETPLLKLPAPWYTHEPPKYIAPTPPFSLAQELAKQREPSLVPPLLPPVPGGSGEGVLPILPEMK